MHLEVWDRKCDRALQHPEGYIFQEEEVLVQDSNKLGPVWEALCKLEYNPGLNHRNNHLGPLLEHRPLSSR